MKTQKDTFCIVYDYVCDNPGLSTYEISKNLKMSGGKVRYALIELEKCKLIKFKFKTEVSRIKKLTYPVETWKLLPGFLRKELVKFKYKRKS